MMLRKSPAPSRKTANAAGKASSRQGKARTRDRLPGQTLTLTLYVSAGAPNSMLAISNLEALCRDPALAKANIEIVDVFREPDRALEASVLLTPTLVREAPGDPVIILGNLSDTKIVLNALVLK
jgi:circadian clock protein KaiB